MTLQDYELKFEKIRSETVKEINKLEKLIKLHGQYEEGENFKSTIRKKLVKSFEKELEMENKFLNRLLKTLP